MIQDSLFKNAPTSPRSLEEKKQCVQSYLNSKLTAKEWCRRNGVSYHTLKNWLYKQRPNWDQHNSVDSSSAAENASRWTRLQIQSSEETSLTIIPAVPAEIRIEFGNIRIFVNSATPTDLLRMVLSEVTSQ